MLQTTYLPMCHAGGGMSWRLYLIYSPEFMSIFTNYKRNRIPYILEICFTISISANINKLITCITRIL